MSTCHLALLTCSQVKKTSRGGVVREHIKDKLGIVIKRNVFLDSFNLKRKCYNMSSDKEVEPVKRR